MAAKCVTMCVMDARNAPPIGKMIKRAREKKRWSQQEAADKLGVSRSALNAWENDRAYPRSSIGALEALYGIAIDDEPEQEEPEEMPTPEELNDLRDRIRDILGSRAPRVLSALDETVKEDAASAASGDRPAGQRS